MFKTTEKTDKVVDFFRNRHKNVKFTIEKEQNQKLPFLDIHHTKTSNSRITINCKQSTDTGLLTNYLSFIPTRCKLGLIKTVDQLYKISNTWFSFHNDVEKTMNEQEYQDSNLK